jgi:cytochrome bd ubiquinol oxidase subunit II
VFIRRRRLASPRPGRQAAPWNAGSSPHALQIMFGAVLLFLPLIVLYTRWIYRVMRGPITVEQIRDQGNRLY